jgi:tetratricopeptide (TPR) repeat protein
MRKLLAQIGDRVKGFIDQRDDLTLVLSSPASDALPMLTLLEQVEAGTASDMFWTFTDNFTDARGYAGLLVSLFATKHEGVRLAMQKEGMPPWPAIPQRILSGDAAPAQRLRELAAFSRRLLPIPNGGNIVWTFYPLEVADYRGYARLMRQVVHHDFPNPWCHHLRFIIRDEPATPAVREALSASPRVQLYEPDLSHDAVQRSIEDEAADESLPLEERLTNFLMLAGGDQANRRYPEALEKYSLLLQYHAPMGNLSMAALALNGMGETYEKMGDLESAADSFQAALIPATQAEYPPIPVLLNITLNLANLRYGQERWGEAEGYYDLAQQLATTGRNAPVKIECLDFRGLCQHRQKKFAEAEKSWYDGSVIAAALEELELCRRLVARLHQYYVETGQHARARERREQLDALGLPRTLPT